jgi:hypothetical protein
MTRLFPVNALIENSANKFGHPWKCFSRAERAAELLPFETRDNLDLFCLLIVQRAQHLWYPKTKRAKIGQSS